MENGGGIDSESVAGETPALPGEQPLDSRLAAIYGGLKDAMIGFICNPGSKHRRYIILLFLSLIAAGVACIIPASPKREFLTDKEITAIQDIQAIDGRILIYLDAAKLRLKTAEDRLVGKESSEGDPLEFFTPEDMLDGYYRILKSVMTNVDAAYKQGIRERERVQKALKILKGATETMGKELEVLKKLAEEKKKEEFWNLVNQAIEITRGAHEGAVDGLSQISTAPKKP
jgi:hypothetical protein